MEIYFKAMTTVTIKSSICMLRHIYNTTTEQRETVRERIMRTYHRKSLAYREDKYRNITEIYNLSGLSYDDISINLTVEKYILMKLIYAELWSGTVC